MCKFCAEERHVHSSTMCAGGCDCERLALVWSKRKVPRPQGQGLDVRVQIL